MLVAGAALVLAQTSQAYDKRHRISLVASPLSVSSKVSGYLPNARRVDRYMLAAIHYEVRAISILHLGVLTETNAMGAGLAGTLGLSGAIGRVTVGGGAAVGGAWLWRPEDQPGGTRVDLYLHGGYAVTESIVLGLRFGLSAAGFGSAADGTSNYYWTFPVAFIATYRL